MQHRAKTGTDDLLGCCPEPVLFIICLLIQLPWRGTKYFGLVSAVGADLPAGGAQVVDCAGMLLFPGFIDGHTHFDVRGWEAGDSRPAALASSVRARITPSFSQWTPAMPPASLPPLPPAGGRRLRRAGLRPGGEIRLRPAHPEEGGPGRAVGGPGKRGDRHRTATAKGSFTQAILPNSVTLNLTCSAKGVLS